MAAFLIPIFYGVITYIGIATGASLVIGFIIYPIIGSGIILVPMFCVPIPLFVSSFVASKNTKSNFRSRRILLGMIAALIGLLIISIPLEVIRWVGTDEAWFLISILIGACGISLLGAFFGTRKEYIE